MFMYMFFYLINTKIDSVTFFKKKIYYYIYFSFFCQHLKPCGILVLTLGSKSMESQPPMESPPSPNQDFPTKEILKPLLLNFYLQSS